jgi:hypothetical protein
VTPTISPTLLAATTLSPNSLPRGKGLTDALTMPASDPPDELLGARLEERIVRAVTAHGQHSAVGKVLRVGAYDLAQALESHLGAQADVPGFSSGVEPRSSSTFRWTGRRARRAIGLAAVRACVEGRAGTPSEAVAMVMAGPGSLPGTAVGGPGSCAEWAATLPPAPRAIVRAEATTWATQLWTAVDWKRVRPFAAVGPPDRWWVHNGSARVGLRGRVDLRVAVVGGSACLSVLPGHPTCASRTTMMLVPLVDLLRLGPGRTPTRVIGWWPDTGKAWIVPVDAVSLTAVTAATALCLRARLRELGDTSPRNPSRGRAARPPGKPATAPKPRPPSTEGSRCPRFSSADGLRS